MMITNRMIKISGGIASYWLLSSVLFMFFYPMISLINARKAARGSVAIQILRIRFLILW